MDAKTKQQASLWDWCMRNLTPNTRWRFDGPAPGDSAVVMEIYHLHWNKPEGLEAQFEIELNTITVIGPDGTEREAAPAGDVALPDWFSAYQSGPTPFFMLSTVFKEQVDAGRVHKLTPERA